MHFRQRHAVVQVLQRLAQHGIGRYGRIEPIARSLDQIPQRGAIQEEAAFAVDHVQLGRRRLPLVAPAGALLGAALPVQHIGPRHVVRAGPHQGKLDLVLNVLDMEAAARRLVPQQRADDR